MEDRRGRGRGGQVGGGACQGQPHSCRNWENKTPRFESPGPAAPSFPPTNWITRNDVQFLSGLRNGVQEPRDLYEPLLTVASLPFLLPSLSSTPSTSSPLPPFFLHHFNFLYLPPFIQPPVQPSLSFPFLPSTLSTTSPLPLSSLNPFNLPSPSPFFPPPLQSPLPSPLLSTTSSSFPPLPLSSFHRVKRKKKE